MSDASPRPSRALTLARQQWERRDWEGLLAWDQPELELHPDKAILQFMMSIAYFESGNHKKSKILQKKARLDINKNKNLFREYFKKKPIHFEDRNNEILYIISSIDPVSIYDYKELINSIKKNNNGLIFKTVCIYGKNFSPDQLLYLDEIVDELFPQERLNSFFKYNKEEILNSINHPFGKFAKLYLVRDYIELLLSKNDKFIFLDPDVIVQGNLEEIVLFSNKKILFGHEVKLIEYENAHNKRLNYANIFDKNNDYLKSYVAEINTGVIISRVHLFVELINKLESMMVDSYLKNIKKFPKEHRWHDQDYFRYFYRKYMPDQISILSYEKIFTTNSIGSKMVRYIDGYYKTIWGSTPTIVHFAGGTKKEILHA